MCTHRTLDRRIRCYANFEIAAERPAPLEAMISESSVPWSVGRGDHPLQILTQNQLFPTAFPDFVQQNGNHRATERSFWIDLAGVEYKAHEAN